MDREKVSLIRPHRDMYSERDTKQRTEKKQKNIRSDNGTRRMELTRYLTRSTSDVPRRNYYTNGAFLLRSYGMTIRRLTNLLVTSIYSMQTIS